MALPNGKIDPLYASVQALGDTWSWLVMHDVLLAEVSRFNQLQRRLGISRGMLSARLDSLVSHGILERHNEPTGQAVHYRPTEIGQDLFVPIVVATRWGRDWCMTPDESSASMKHLNCGHDFAAQLRCAACNEPIDARNVKASSDATTRGVRTGDRTRLVRSGHRAKGNRDPLEETLAVIGDRWTSLIIRECFFGARRFDTFTTTLGIATNTLTSRLKHLVDNGVLDRVEYQQVPMRHEYRLTDKGLAAYPIPLALLTWGTRWFNTNTAPIELIHITCDQPLEPQLVCEACGLAADHGTVTVADDPADDPSSD